MLRCVYCDPVQVFMEPKCPIAVGLSAVWATRSIVQALWAAFDWLEGGTAHSLGSSFKIRMHALDLRQGRHVASRRVSLFCIMVAHSLACNRDQFVDGLRFKEQRVTVGLGTAAEGFHPRHGYS